MCNETSSSSVSRSGDRNTAGTPSARLGFLLDELAKRFPEAHAPFRSDPPELRYLAAIDALLSEGKGG